MKENFIGAKSIYARVLIRSFGKLNFAVDTTYVRSRGCCAFENQKKKIVTAIILLLSTLSNRGTTNFPLKPIDITDTNGNEMRKKKLSEHIVSGRVYQSKGFRQQRIVHRPHFHVMSLFFHYFHLKKARY